MLALVCLSPGPDLTTVGAFILPAACVPCQHKELRQKQAKMSHCVPKYSFKREKQMRELSLLTLEPQEGVWHLLALAARPEKSHPVGEAGAWNGIAAKRRFLDLDFSLFQGLLNWLGPQCEV